MSRAAPTASLAVGQRVQMHAFTDRWMQGDRFGTIERLGRKLASVRMDRSGRMLKTHPSHFAVIEAEA
jgi:uncharacterized protein Veg